MNKANSERKGFYGWLGNTLQQRSRWVILVTILITILLLYPFVFMVPTETASDNPTGNTVVKLLDDIEDTFSLEVYDIFFIVEAKDGDMLTRKNLHELYEREQALRESDLSSFLYMRFDEEANTTVQGMFTLADAINQGIIEKSGETADISNDFITDAQIKKAVQGLLSNQQTQGFVDTLSAEKRLTDEGWVSPALIVGVSTVDELVLSEYLSDKDIGEATKEKESLAREKFSREVQDIMRGEQSQNKVWGVAIDLELEIEDEGKIAIVLLSVALVLMAILLFFIFRSWWIMSITLGGLLMLIVWLKGFSNLVGLKSSPVLDFIVPVAIVVLGVDYAIQALFRYLQEKDKGTLPRITLGNSTYRVGQALVLAMFTTIVAFGSNASAGIESVIGFAVAASLAIFSSFIILGLFVPTVNMRWQERRKHSNTQTQTSTNSARHGGRLATIVCAVSDRWFVALPVIIIVTIFAAWGWLNVETKFDAKDALDPKSDFVVSLDKWDEHGADKGGEPSYLYYEGDLTQHEALNAMKATVKEMDDNIYIGRSPIGNKPNTDILLFDILEIATTNDYAREQIQIAKGIEITDEDGDLFPDSRQQLQATYDYVIENGLPQNENTLRFNTKQVEERFVRLDSGAYATFMLIGVPGTREQEIVKLASDELNHDLDLSASGIESIKRYGLTGTGDVRVVQFNAISDSLSKSLIIAVVAVLGLLIIVFSSWRHAVLGITTVLLLGLFLNQYNNTSDVIYAVLAVFAAGLLVGVSVIFRSLRYAIMTIIPVLLVASWLYGFMYAAGYSLNMLTATIAAIAIGVGIDFSIHFTERFREELEINGDKRSAIQITSQTTGLALFSAALTTAVGFMVIAFAPMPMFSTFGILTTIMIILSLFMALFVLPSLLHVFAPGPTKKE